MMCWPANLVAVFSVIIILFDLVQHQWTLLWIHALGGVVATGVFWLLCSILGTQIAGAILYVPLIFVFVFALGVLFTKASLNRQGCCVTCAGANGTNGENGTNGSDSASGSNGASVNPECESEKQKLKGRPLV